MQYVSHGSAECTTHDLLQFNQLKTVLPVLEHMRYVAVW